MNVKPCNPVGVITGAINSDFDVPIADIFKPGVCSGLPSGPSLCPTGKRAGVWVVVEKFTQTLCGKIGLSHDALLMLIGQKPGSVSALAGLLHFTTLRACVLCAFGVSLIVSQSILGIWAKPKTSLYAQRKKPI
jgi:hypothetical protein